MTVLDRQRQNSPNTQDAASDAEQWYVSRNDKEYGPLRFCDLAQFVQQKRLLGDDWVWRPGFASWIAAAEVSGLFTGPDRDEYTQPDRRTAGDSVDTKSKHDFKERAKHQVKDFALMFFYLWIVFGMLAVHESIILSQHQIDFQLHGLALINALIFAKVMLVAEDLHLGRRLNDQPLVHSIIFKSIMFAIAADMFSHSRACRHRDVAWPNHSRKHCRGGRQSTEWDRVDRVDWNGCAGAILHIAGAQPGDRAR